jgi:hypothetical protein
MLVTQQADSKTEDESNAEISTNGGDAVGVTDDFNVEYNIDPNVIEIEGT